MPTQASFANEETGDSFPESSTETTLQPNSLEFKGWERGYLQVYTGDGKGKTTAALGLTLRAIGNGARVFIGQFMKNGDYGEIKALQSFTENVRIQQFGTGQFINRKMALDDYKSCRQGIHTIKHVLISGDYHLVILDEINTALCCGLLTVKELMGIARLKPDNLELVFTGRYAPPQVLEIADLVTEMKEVKHYYHTGVAARPAIEK
jgi:cob(I)alamin adenosyltransferase